MTGLTPPRFAQWLLRLQPLGVRRAEIEADLHELYVARARERGLGHARWRYYRDVLSLWRTPGTREAAVTSWSWPELGPTVAGLRQDLAYGGRLVRRSPGVVLIAVAGLGVAIGVSTSIFSIVNGLAFKPSGIDDSRSVMRILRRDARGSSGTWRYSELVQLREASSAPPIEGWLIERHSLFPAEGLEGPAASAMFVTGGYLATLTARVTAGRLLTAADGQPDAQPVAVLSHGFWARQLGQDPGIVGRTARWNGVEVTIVGVAARGFRGTSESAPDLWAPIAALPRLVGARIGPETSQPAALFTRIPQGAAASQTEARLTATVAALPALPSAGQDSGPASGVRLGSAESSMPGSKRASIITALVIVMIAMGLLLTLACVNVANLLLAHGVARRGELGVRIALGASRARVVRQLLGDSLRPVTIGLGAGVLIALAGSRVIAGALYGVGPSDPIAFAGAVAILLVAVLPALLGPARRATTVDPAGVLKSV